MKAENPPQYSWSSSSVFRNEMLGPPTDMLGLPNMEHQQVTPEKLVKYYEGQIHQAMEFLPAEQIKEIVKKAPDCVHEKGNGLYSLLLPHNDG